MATKIGIYFDQSAIGGGLDGSLNLFQRSGFFKTAGKVNNRNVKRWNTECHTCQFSVKLRDNLANSLRRTCR
jgi:hypothetical protein